MVEVEESKQYESIKIPKDIDYKKIKGLSNEVLSKFELIRPLNLLHASRIEGVTPAAMTLINLYLKRNRLTIKEKNAKWFVHIFGGVAHAFTNPDADDEPNGLKYNRDAMHMSWKIMKNYFNRFLHKKL